MPSIPLDVDEVDSALEKFIRQKYDQQLFSSGVPRAAVLHHTGSTRSSDDQPPPLPPKPGKRFGFGLRSVSSALPLGRSRRQSPPDSPDGSDHGAPPSPIRMNKQSRVFGASVGGPNGEDLELKLATLRDMGFPDDKRNVNILKGLGGNLERSIEALVRLGEGSAPSSRSRTPALPRNIAVSQPLPPSKSAQPVQEINGARVVNDAFDPQFQPKPQSQAAIPHDFAGEQTDRSFSPTHSQISDRSFSPSNPFQPRPYNPFEASTAPSSATLPLDKAFEGMHVSQPLFPNATGGYPKPQHHVQDARAQHSMTPPIPLMPQHRFQFNQQSQQEQAPTGNYNPFLHSPQVSQTSTNPYASSMQQNTTSSPPPMMIQSAGLQSPTNPFFSQQPQQHIPQPQYQFSQILPIQQPLQQSSLQNNFGMPPTNPFMSQQGLIYQEAVPLQQNQPLQAQPTGRFDKSSILALYNYPQLAPPPLQNISEDTVTQTPQISDSPGTQTSTGLQPKPTQRSVTMPVQLASGSRNPFQSAGPPNPSPVMVSSPSTNGTGMSRHVSQESVDIGGYHNGRHSPDAFSGLSARYVR